VRVCLTRLEIAGAQGLWRLPAALQLQLALHIRAAAGGGLPPWQAWARLEALVQRGSAQRQRQAHPAAQEQGQGHEQQTGEEGGGRWMREVRMRGRSRDGGMGQGQGQGQGHG